MIEKKSAIRGQKTKIKKVTQLLEKMSLKSVCARCGNHLSPYELDIMRMVVSLLGNEYNVAFCSGCRLGKIREEVNRL